MKSRTVGFLSGTVFGAALAVPVGFWYGVKGVMLYLEEKHPTIHKELKYRIRTEDIADYYDYE